MMNAVTKCALGVLSALCLAEGYHLGSRSAARPVPPVLPAEAPTAAAGVRSVLTSTDREVIVAVSVPGLRAESLEVEVDGILVRVLCVADARDSTLRYEIVLPVPVNADASRHRVVREGETFRIIFELVVDRPLNF